MVVAKKTFLRWWVYTFLNFQNFKLLIASRFGVYGQIRGVSQKFLALYMNKHNTTLVNNFFFSQLGKLARRAMCRCFFLFIFIFLMVDFGEPVAQNLMDRSSPKYQDW